MPCWLCLCACHRCEETLILECPVFKLIPVCQSPVVLSELWHSLGGCQGSFVMLWRNRLAHTLSVCRIPSHYPSGFRGQSIFKVAGQNNMSMDGIGKSHWCLYTFCLNYRSLDIHYVFYFIFYWCMQKENIYKSKQKRLQAKWVE